MYDYVIYGAGPTGITLALGLVKKGYTVALIEREDSIGGCWRVNWKDGYFTEHAPKITLNDGKNFSKLFEILGLDFNKETENVYKDSTIANNIDIISYIFFGLSIYDMIKLTVYYIGNSIGVKISDVSVKNWMIAQNITEKGQETIGKLCILLSDIPEKVMLLDFLGSFDFRSIIKLKNPETWVKKAHAVLKESGVDIYLNTKVSSLNDINGEVYNGVVKGINHILALPPLAFYELLQSSSWNVKNNWGDLSPVLLNSYYNSLGFQLHFDKDIVFSKKVCWFCKTNGIAIKYTFSKTYSVLSCTIIDQRNLKGSLNDNIIKVAREFENIVGEKYTKLTINDGIQSNSYKNKHIKYNSKDTSYTRTEHGTVPQKGSADNIFTIGSHNKPGITTANKAISIAFEFVKNTKDK